MPAGLVYDRGRRYRRGERQGPALDRAHLPDDDLPDGDDPDGSAAKLSEDDLGDRGGATGSDRRRPVLGLAIVG